MRCTPVLLVAGLLVGTLGAQETVVLRGSQTRGAPGRDAQLRSEAITLPRPATLVQVEGGEAGFWIEGSGRSWTFQGPAEAKGQRFPAGTYRVYPNLGKGQDKATATLTFTLVAH